MTKCLNCNKEIGQTEGKREKKFCSDNCRAAYHVKNRPKTPKYVQYSTFKELADKFYALQEEVANKPLNKTNEIEKVETETGEKKLTIKDMPKNLTFFQKIAWKTENGIK